MKASAVIVAAGISERFGGSTPKQFKMVCGRPLLTWTISRFEEAVGFFERSLEIAESASTRSNLGTAHYYLGRYEESVEHYRRAIELQPDHGVHRANLGDALFKLDRNDAARSAYREAADLALAQSLREPLNPDVQSDLALYCAKAGDESCAGNWRGYKRRRTEVKNHKMCNQRLYTELYQRNSDGRCYDHVSSNPAGGHPEYHAQH